MGGYNTQYTVVRDKRTKYTWNKSNSNLSMLYGVVQFAILINLLWNNYIDVVIALAWIIDCLETYFSVARSDCLLLDIYRCVITGWTVVQALC